LAPALPSAPILKPLGTHGNDIRYIARVTATRQLRDHEKLTVKFRLGDSKPVKRLVKVYEARELSRY
jgi:hypothetical protein